MKSYLVLLFIGSSLLASEPAFIPPFTQISAELEKASVNKKELDDNFNKLQALSAKNILLEAEISSVLQQLSKAPDFNNELLIIKAKTIENDIARAKAMDDGYTNINKEIEGRWKTQ